jgi:hypothetical protein
MKRNAFLALRIAIHARFVPHASPAGRGRFRRVLLQVLNLLDKSSHGPQDSRIQKSSDQESLQRTNSFN